MSPICVDNTIDGLLAIAGGSAVDKAGMKESIDQVCCNAMVG